MMSDKGGATVSESLSEVNASKPLNIQRALLMRSMSNEELVHKLKQYYPSYIYTTKNIFKTIYFLI